MVMAFKKNIIDLSGILAWVVLFLPSIAANIDCNGKPFHCVNTTHFMICVDLGSGVSSTIDDFIITCPPTTVCAATNRFECEFPAATTTTTTTFAPIPLVTESVSVETTSLVNDVTTSTPFEEYFNSIDSNTLADVTVSTPTVTEAEAAATVSDFTENVNVLTMNDIITTESVDVVNNDPTTFYQPSDSIGGLSTNILAKPVTDLTQNLNVVIPQAESNSTLNKTKIQMVYVDVQNDSTKDIQSNITLPGNMVFSDVSESNANLLNFNSSFSETVKSVSADAVQHEMTTTVQPSSYPSTLETKSILTDGTKSLSGVKQEFEYNSTSNRPIVIVSNDLQNGTNLNQQNRTTSGEPSSTDYPDNFVTESILTDVIKNLTVIMQESVNTTTSQNIPLISNDFQNDNNVYAQNNISTKIDNNNSTNYTVMNVTNFETGPYLSEAASSISADAVQYEATTVFGQSSRDYPDIVVTETTLKDATSKLTPIIQGSEYNITSNQTIPIVSDGTQNETNSYSHKSTISGIGDNDTATNYIVINVVDPALNKTVSSVSVDAVQYEPMTFFTPSSTDYPDNVVTETTLTDATSNLSAIIQGSENNITSNLTIPIVSDSIQNETNSYSQNSTLSGKSNNDTATNYIVINVIDPALNKTVSSASVDAVQYEPTTFFAPSSIDYPDNVVTETILKDVKRILPVVNQESEYNITSNPSIPIVSNDLQNETKSDEQNSTLHSKIDSDTVTNSIVINVNDPALNKAVPSVSVDGVQYEPTTIFAPSSTDYPDHFVTESILTDVIKNLTVIMQESVNTTTSQNIPLISNDFQNDNNVYAQNNISTKIDNDNSTNYTVMNVTNSETGPYLSEAASSISADAVQYEATTVFGQSSRDYPDIVVTETTLKDATSKLTPIIQGSEYNITSIQTIPIVSDGTQNETNSYSHKSTLSGIGDNDTATNYIVINVVDPALNKTVSSVSVDAVQYEPTTFFAPSSTDYPDNVVTETILKDVKRILPVVNQESEYNITSNPSIPIVSNDLQNETKSDEQNRTLPSKVDSDALTNSTVINVNDPALNKAVPSVSVDAVQYELTTIFASSTDYPDNVVTETTLTDATSNLSAIIQGSENNIFSDLTIPIVLDGTQKTNSYSQNSTLSGKGDNDTAKNYIVINVVDPALNKTVSSVSVDAVQYEPTTFLAPSSTDYPDNVVTETILKDVKRILPIANQESEYNITSNLSIPIVSNDLQNETKSDEQNSMLPSEVDSDTVTSSIVINVNDPALNKAIPSVSVDAVQYEPTTIFASSTDYPDNVITETILTDATSNLSAIIQGSENNITSNLTIPIVSDSIQNKTNSYSQNSTLSSKSDNDTAKNYIVINVIDPALNKTVSSVSVDAVQYEPTKFFAPSSTDYPDNFITETILTNVERILPVGNQESEYITTSNPSILIVPNGLQNETNSDEQNKTLPSKVDSDTVTNSTVINVNDPASNRAVSSVSVDAMQYEPTTLFAPSSTDYPDNVVTETILKDVKRILPIVNQESEYNITSNPSMPIVSNDLQNENKSDEQNSTLPSKVDSNTVTNSTVINVNDAALNKAVPSVSVDAVQYEPTALFAPSSTDYPDNVVTETIIKDVKIILPIVNQESEYNITSNPSMPIVSNDLQNENKSDEQNSSLPSKVDSNTVTNSIVINVNDPALNKAVPSVSVDAVQYEPTPLLAPSSTDYLDNVVIETTLTDTTRNLAAILQGSEYNITSNQSIPIVSDGLQNKTNSMQNSTSSKTDYDNVTNSVAIKVNDHALNKAIPSVSAGTVQNEPPTVFTTSIADYPDNFVTESILTDVTRILPVIPPESEYNISSTFPIVPDGLQNDSDTVTNYNVINVTDFETNPTLREDISSVLVDALQYEPTTLFTPSSTDYPDNIATETTLKDVTRTLTVKEEFATNITSRQTILIEIDVPQNKNKSYTQNSTLPGKISYDAVTNSTVINVIVPDLSKAVPSVSVDGVQYERTTLFTPSSTDYLDNFVTETILTDFTRILPVVNQESEYNITSNQTIAVRTNDLRNETNSYSQNSTLSSKRDNDTATNYIVIKLIDRALNKTVSSDSADETTLVAPISTDLSSNIESNSILKDITGILNTDKQQSKFTSSQTIVSNHFKNVTNMQNSTLLRIINATESVPEFHSSSAYPNIPDDTAKMQEATLNVRSRMGIPINLVTETELINVTKRSNALVESNIVQNDIVMNTQSNFGLDNTLDNIVMKSTINNMTERETQVAQSLNEIIKKVPFHVKQKTLNRTDVSLDAADVALNSNMLTPESEHKANLIYNNFSLSVDVQNGSTINSRLSNMSIQINDYVKESIITNGSRSEVFPTLKGTYSNVLPDELHYGVTITLASTELPNISVPAPKAVYGTDGLNVLETKPKSNTKSNEIISTTNMQVGKVNYTPNNSYTSSFFEDIGLLTQLNEINVTDVYGNESIDTIKNISTPLFESNSSFFLNNIVKESTTMEVTERLKVVKDEQESKNFLTESVVNGIIHDTGRTEGEMPVLEKLNILNSSYLNMDKNTTENISLTGNRDTVNPEKLLNSITKGNSQFTMETDNINQLRINLDKSPIHYSNLKTVTTPRMNLESITTISNNSFTSTFNSSTNEVIKQKNEPSFPLTVEGTTTKSEYVPNVITANYVPSADTHHVYGPLDVNIIADLTTPIFGDQVFPSQNNKTPEEVSLYTPELVTNSTQSESVNTLTTPKIFETIEIITDIPVFTTENQVNVYDFVPTGTTESLNKINTFDSPVTSDSPKLANESVAGTGPSTEQNNPLNNLVPNSLPILISRGPETKPNLSQQTNIIKLSHTLNPPYLTLIQNLDTTTYISRGIETKNKASNAEEDAKSLISIANSIANEKTSGQLTSIGPEITKIDNKRKEINIPNNQTLESNLATTRLEREIINTQNKNAIDTVIKIPMNPYTPDVDVVILDMEKNINSHSEILATPKLSKKFIELSKGGENVKKENTEISELNNFADSKDSKTIYRVNTKLGQEQNENIVQTSKPDKAASTLPLNKEATRLENTIMKTSTKAEDTSESSYKSKNIEMSIKNSSTKHSAEGKITVKEPSSILPNVQYVPVTSTKSNVNSEPITIKSNIASSTARYSPPTVSTFVHTNNTALRRSATTYHPNFICKTRGRYSDDRDCRKFYTCVGKPQPIEGNCPNNTVFSETKKLCTKNLSLCYRNNQFQCVSVGRFCDVLKDNIYYICVKNSVGAFVRFKLQCQSGYYLNKTSILCAMNTQSSQASSVINSNKTVQIISSIRNENLVESIEKSTSSDVSKNNSDQSLSSAKVEEIVTKKPFECKEEGKFADSKNCRKYYICIKITKSRYRKKSKKCDSDEIFHNDKKKCVDADSYECSTD